jgi:hypothetical protein
MFVKEFLALGSEEEVECARKLTLLLLSVVSTFDSLGVAVPLLFGLNKSSLEPKLKLGSVGMLGSLKFASCQLSLRAFSRLFAITCTFSKRESSPREDAKDLWRYRSNEPSELDLRRRPVGRLWILAPGSGLSESEAGSLSDENCCCRMGAVAGWRSGDRLGRDGASRESSSVEE